MAEPPTLDALPPETLKSHVAILGTQGAGKTYGAKGEVELLLDAGARVCIIDPTGAWWGLRLTEDGDEPSRFKLPIFGGLGPKGRVPPQADVAIAASSGARMAELIADGDFSCIIDVSRMTVADRTRFFSDFAETLAAAADRRPLHLVIDEAHLLAPQGKVPDPQAGKMLASANHLVSGGRVLGLRVMLLSQRGSKLHKDTLTQAQTLVAMLNIHPLDRAAVNDWIKDSADPKQGREIVASLPSLPTGEGWVWAPRLGVLAPIRFRRITTFDSSATPDDDNAPAAGPRLGELDLEELKAALAGEGASVTKGVENLPALDEARLTTARDAAFARGVEAGRVQEREFLQAHVLRHPFVQLQMRRAEHLGAKTMAEKIAGDLDAIVKRAIGERAALLQASQAPDPLKIEAFWADPQLRAQAIDAATADPLVAPPTRAPKTEGPTDAPPPVAALSAPPADRSPPAERPSETEGATPLSKPQARVLGAIAWWRAMGRSQPARGQICAVVGWSPTSSNIRDRLTELVGHGLVTYPRPGHAELTKAGRGAAPKGMFAAAKPLEGLRGVLSNPQRAVFDALVKAGGQASRDHLAKAVGWATTSSNIRDRATELSRLEIVDYPTPGSLRLTAWVAEIVARTT